ncbi:MAG: bifunctional glycosyltransferase family 2/GtrA family protein [Patescibacteria group bacterium]
MKKILAIIPAYNPNEKLLTIINGLEQANIFKIIIINDGSDKNMQWIFNKIKKNPKVILLKHTKNLGKGAALKTGLNYYNTHFKDQIGVVTVDADGQHLKKDVFKIADSLIQNPNKLILGVRKFKGKIPFRSKFGNQLTKYLFNFSSGTKIKDTQTGLRAIPSKFIPKILKIQTNHYEFEMEMLYKALDNKISIKQIPISTIYEDNNSDSHFNPIKDSYKIYKIIFKYSLVSLVSSGLDYILFLSFLYLIDNIILASMSARILSAFFYYYLNKETVFKSNKKIIKSLTGFIILILINPLITGIMTTLLESVFGLPPSIGKVIAEAFMFIINFLVQYKFIF